jgi:hypothetical protein
MRVQGTKFEVFGTSNSSNFETLTETFFGEASALSPVPPKPIDYPLSEAHRLDPIELPIQSTRSSPTSKSITILSDSWTIAVPARKA